MKRLLKNAAIDCNDFCNKIEETKQNLIRIMNNFSDSWTNFENQNNIQINKDCIPTNTSNNPFNMNCNFGDNFKDIGNYFNLFFNELKENIKQQVGEINTGEQESSEQ